MPPIGLWSSLLIIITTSINWGNSHPQQAHRSPPRASPGPLLRPRPARSLTGFSSVPNAYHPMQAMTPPTLPADFNDFVGNSSTVESLRTAIAGGRLPHSLILAGPSGAGKYRSEEHTSELQSLRH